MRATLVRYEKFIVRRRFTIDIEVHQVPTYGRYEDGLKWGLICVDRVSGRRILMDNHHPKGPHVHIDTDGSTELPYEFKGLDQLIEDFRRLVTEHMGVRI